MEERCTDESPVRLKELELRLDQGKQLLFKRSTSKLRVLSHSCNRVVNLEIKEVKRNVFLGLEVIEYCAFSDPCAARNGLGGRRIKTLFPEEPERCAHDPRANGGAVLLAAALTGRSLPSICGSAGLRHKYEYTHIKYECTHLTCQIGNFLQRQISPLPRL